VLIVLPAGIILTLLRDLTHLRLSAITAAAIAVWYIDGLLTSAIDSMRASITNVGPAVLVALGTLFAVVYAAANSDLRGRSELNKVASVTCRTILLESARPMLIVASRLESIRQLAIIRLAYFPTCKELHDLTGRTDLLWHGRLLLPESVLRRSLYGRLISLFSSKAIPNDPTPYSSIVSLCRPSQDLERALLAREDIASELEDLERSVAEIYESMRKLQDSGFHSKLTRVLGARGAGCLDLLIDRHFGASWIDYVLTTRAEEPTEYWWNSWFMPNPGHITPIAPSPCEWPSSTDGSLSSGQILLAIYRTNAFIRATVRKQLFTYWWLSVDANRIRYLIRKIDSTLQPGPWERIRQAFSK
jgi:hypothetical protein